MKDILDNINTTTQQMIEDLTMAYDGDMEAVTRVCNDIHVLFKSRRDLMLSMNGQYSATTKTLNA